MIALSRPPTVTWLGESSARERARRVALLNCRQGTNSAPWGIAIPVIPLGQRLRVEGGEAVRIGDRHQHEAARDHRHRDPDSRQARCRSAVR